MAEAHVNYQPVQEMSRNPVVGPSQERTFDNPPSGFCCLFLVLVGAILIPASIVPGIVLEIWALIPIGVVIGVFLVIVPSAGLVVVQPNTAVVLTLCGKYYGTIKDNGFFWVNPLTVKRQISLRINNIETRPLKCNDKQGNPIEIGIVLAYKVQDTFRASFEVQNYMSYVNTQIDAAIRKLASHYSYDNFADDVSEVTLRSGGEEVNHVLEREIASHISVAGIRCVEARINHLAYASEIASAMLQRQEATALVSARKKIVQGAVGIVEMALEEIERKRIVEFDMSRRAAMVSNLLVVLCSERNAQPVMETGF